MTVSLEFLYEILHRPSIDIGNKHLLISVSCSCSRIQMSAIGYLSIIEEAITMYGIVGSPPLVWSKMVLTAKNSPTTVIANMQKCVAKNPACLVANIVLWCSLVVHSDLLF